MESMTGRPWRCATHHPALVRLSTHGIRSIGGIRVEIQQTDIFPVPHDTAMQHNHTLDCSAEPRSNHPAVPAMLHGCGMESMEDPPELILPCSVIFRNRPFSFDTSPQFRISSRRLHDPDRDATLPTVCILFLTDDGGAVRLCPLGASPARPAPHPPRMPLGFRRGANRVFRRSCAPGLWSQRGAPCRNPGS